jgi:hypothetical protein
VPAAQTPLGRATSRSALASEPPVDAGPRPVNRLLLYAGTALAALTVLALGGWLLTRAAG